MPGIANAHPHKNRSGLLPEIWLVPATGIAANCGHTQRSLIPVLVSDCALWSPHSFGCWVFNLVKKISSQLQYTTSHYTCLRNDTTAPTIARALSCYMWKD